MAKKFGKFVMTTAVLGAIAAGAYYFFMKKDAFFDEDFDDDYYDDFDEDLDDDVAADKSETDRKYVDLDLTKASEKVEEAVEEKADEFKEGLNAVKAEATDKIVGAAKETAEAVNEAEAKVEEFFDDEDEEDDSDNSLDAI